MSKVKLKKQKYFNSVVVVVDVCVNNIASFLLQCVNSGLFTKTTSKPTSFSAPSLPSSDPQSVSVRLKKTSIFC